MYNGSDPHLLEDSKKLEVLRYWPLLRPTYTKFRPSSYQVRLKRHLSVQAILQRIVSVIYRVTTDAAPMQCWLLVTHLPEPTTRRRKMKTMRYGFIAADAQIPEGMFSVDCNIETRVLISFFLFLLMTDVVSFWLFYQSWMNGVDRIWCTPDCCRW